MTRLLFAFALISPLNTQIVLHAQKTVVHARDGGTQQTMQSVEIAPVPNEAFTAVVRTQWTHIMPDGSTGTVFNHRTVVRDSAGRVFQERRFLLPHGDTEVTPISVLQYDDPNRHQRLICRPVQRLCEVYRLSTETTEALAPAGPLPHGTGTLTREDLGRKSMQNLDVVGSREVVTFNAGVFGNEKPQPVVKEFWYAPRLSLNLVTRRFDPRVSSVQNIEVTEVQFTEPDPKLFEPPAGYRMLSMDAPQ